jgi:hypothetical protein
MIARIWTGRVRPSNAAAYIKLMHDIAIPDYRQIEGNTGAWCLHRESAIEVKMVTFWRDWAAIHTFAGDGDTVERAKYYDFDPDMLLDLPETVEHYEMSY